MEKQLNIALPQPAVQYILNLLAERPYKEVAELVPLIMQQATAQLQPSPPSPAAPADTP